MPNFLAQIRALDTAIAQGLPADAIAPSTPPRIEPRAERRAKAHDAKAAS